MNTNLSYSEYVPTLTFDELYPGPIFRDDRIKQDKDIIQNKQNNGQPDVSNKANNKHK
jgi:hypothetical protein